MKARKTWVDAYNEGSDALEALNKKFDEYFNTMLTKQLMNRAASKYIQPILEAFDKAVSEGSEGGNNGLDVTKKEIEGIMELKDKNPDFLLANRTALDALRSKKVSTQTQILLDQLLADEKEEIVFAHCTIPINMISSPKLMTHYESGIGVALRGKLEEREVTIFKLGSDLKSYFVEADQNGLKFEDYLKITL